MLTALSHADGPPALINSRASSSRSARWWRWAACCWSSSWPAAHLLLDGAGRAAAAFIAKVHPSSGHPGSGHVITGVFVATFAAFANIAEVVDLTNIGTSSPSSWSRSA
jgi:hypothetical protein